MIDGVDRWMLTVGLFLVTAVMFHSCVVCAVTAGDVVNLQLARLGAMIIVYSMSIVFFILDSVSHVDAVRQSFPKRMRALPKSQLLQQDMQLPRKHRREISDPTPAEAMVLVDPTTMLLCIVWPCILWPYICCGYLERTLTRAADFWISLPAHAGCAPRCFHL